MEAQQAEAVEKPVASRRKLTPIEAEHVRQKEGLRLSRQRVLQQLQNSRNPRHREILEAQLAALDDRLSALKD